MESAEDQEKRARELADVTRCVLVGMHTGGIGTALALAASLAAQKVEPAWAVLPIGWFVAGLAATLISLS
jgi:hypothetical protein